MAIIVNWEPDLAATVALIHFRSALLLRWLANRDDYQSAPGLTTTGKQPEPPETPK